MIHPGIWYDPTRYTIWSNQVYDMIHPGIRCDPTRYSVCSNQVFGLFQPGIRYAPPYYTIWEYQKPKMGHIEYLVGSYRMPGWIISNSWVDHIKHSPPLFIFVQIERRLKFYQFKQGTNIDYKTNIKEFSLIFSERKLEGSEV